MNRRQFFKASAAAAAAAAVARSNARAQTTQPSTQTPLLPPVNHLPRWRGFNLLEMFDGSHIRPFKESDFAMIADWGFNFVRIPMSYLCWSSQDDWQTMVEQPLTNIDRAIALGRQHGIHVNLNLHRIPGYCVNPPKEPADLWTDENALDAAAYHWGELAKRYKQVPSSVLSFDLINEPADMKTELYVKTITRLVEAIRAASPDRLIIADGLKWGRSPVPELAGLKIGQSTRGYAPIQVSHYKADWMHGSDKWATPTWPLTLGKDVWDKLKLQRDQQPWLALQQRGVGVHVGEWGAYNHTPHGVALAWMKDCLDLWKANNWGWSLWNLSGAFGVLDSGRADVKYEAHLGRKLDREMLELLKAVG